MMDISRDGERFRDCRKVDSINMIRYTFQLRTTVGFHWKTGMALEWWKGLAVAWKKESRISGHLENTNLHTG
jgi:hypothetical protein